MESVRVNYRLFIRRLRACLHVLYLLPPPSLSTSLYFSLPSPKCVFISESETRREKENVCCTHATRKRVVRIEFRAVLQSPVMSRFCAFEGHVPDAACTASQHTP